MRPHLGKMEEMLSKRQYQTKDERGAYRNGFTDGVMLKPRDKNYADYPNAYSAGYWDGFHYIAGDNP